MSREEVTDQLNEIFTKIFKKPDIQIHDEMTAKDVKGWDSLNHINLIVAIEKSFKIKFTTKEIQGLPNVGKLIDVIHQKLG
ncbi:MAG: acyl carrier protein [Leptospiraceae bacterium]|nr:acyl carrier protein [Leptospiraceae bacterium]MCP5512930.1 acyl carrier protein [Leptospiraceae bacterium]